MTTRTHSSTISMKTLRGAFEQPKMHHRRDFLKENKLNLRELQKCTTQKLTQQKQEQEKQQYKHLQKFQKTRDQSLARRSASQCRYVEPTGGGGERVGLTRQSRITAQAYNNGDGVAKSTTSVATKSNSMPYRRAYSQQRQSMENLQPISTCCCSHQQQRQQTKCELQYQEQVPRSVSSASVLSKAESCDKEIQTEDINDEDFLYEALKKCSSSEVRKLCKQKSTDRLHIKDKNLQQTNTHFNQPQYQSDNVEDDHKEQYSARSHNLHLTNGHKQNYIHESSGTEHEKYMSEDLDRQFNDLKLERPLETEVDQLSSARSRQTMCSSRSKARTKLGCREDLRLPRYLEKEKREKEEERLREISKDPNCPLGHYVLSEEERLKALHAAQSRMASLISELNHMPMTTETLRIRNRKAEIEKQLTQIEMDIRFYSKPKVYVAE